MFLELYVTKYHDTGPFLQHLNESINGSHMQAALIECPFQVKCLFKMRHATPLLLHVAFSYAYGANINFVLTHGGDTTQTPAGISMRKYANKRRF